jgi:nucleotide-binding universal stress UspA family protein
LYRQMLVPLDGSNLAEAISTYAKELAVRLSVNLVFLNVCSTEEAELLPMRRVYIERMAKIVNDQSMELQKRILGGTEGKTVEVKAEVVIGYPAEEIIHYTDENKIDLILISTHGRSGIRHWSLGSVADKVLRMSKTPVWVVRASIPREVIHDQWPTKSILVPLDGSELAESALPHVEAVAKQRDAELLQVVLLRVCELADMAFKSPASYRLIPNLIPDPYPPTKPVNQQKYIEQEITKCKKANQKYLAEVAKRLETTGLKVRTEVLVSKAPLEAKPADEILDYANRTATNLIVMATHGRSGLSRWAYGSVAERIVYGGNTPVLLIRPE